MEAFDIRTLWTLIHIFGAIIGAGGAYMSDAMFFSSIKDGRITETELRFMRLGSGLVWFGVVLLIFSGGLLFLGDVDHYLASSKFILKMCVVAVIVINGIFFHRSHMPHIARHVNVHLHKSVSFNKRRYLLLASGAVSFSSWTLAVSLGVLRSIPFTLVQGLLLYFIVLVIAVGTALLLADQILPEHI